MGTRTIRNFSEPHFERYYPAAFSERADVALGEPDKQRRRAAKTQLLEDVRTWLDEDAHRGRAALSESAAAVIAQLEEMAAELS